MSSSAAGGASAESNPFASSVRPLVADRSDTHAIIAAQEQVMAQQDHALDGISRSLGTIKHMGLQIKGELDMQNSLLDEIEHGVDSTSSGMRSAQARMAALLRRTKDCKWILAIAALTAAAVLLLIWVFKFGGKGPS